MIVDATEAFFGDQTPLLNAGRDGSLRYEKRTQQKTMAVEIARRLEHGGCLCVEAPTGVGKTFAYLVPAIFFAMARRVPVVLSTHTISLQEQILEKDVPLLAELTGQPISAAVAKGRANYLCLRRLNAIGDLDQELLDLAVVSHIDRLCTWARDTRSGSVSELTPQPPPELWDSVCCERGNCLNATCPFYTRCFLMKARRHLQTAHLIVANHAMFFSDLGMRTDRHTADVTLLPDYGALILDEGHTIEDCACNHLGIRVGSFALRRILNRLYNPERDSGLVASGDYAELRAATAEARRRTDLFFNRVCDWLEPQQRNPLRYTVPGHVGNYLDSTLLRLENRLEQARSREEDKTREAELAGLGEQVHAQRLGLDLFLNMSEPDYVYWFERHGRGERDISMNAVPVDVGSTLQGLLFNRDIPIVVTSATLAIDGNMAFFQQRIGADKADALVLDSPFDFASQVTIYIPEKLPSPKDQTRFLPEAAEHVREFVGRSRGRAFVLFTSYAMMNDMADLLRDFFEQENLTLLLQGEGMSRSKMLEVFRSDVSSVLFGTASFWTGVDVPGEALSNVIIVRLPFAVPDHPLVAARMEQAECHGQNAFRDYSLPDAILRFRQGFGRLIRTREDSGIVVVLDSRIINTWYGRQFLKAVPQCAVEII